jgi:hypothetical protein
VRNSQEWIVDVKLCVQLLLNCEFFRSFSRFDGSERKAKAERGRERERERQTDSEGEGGVRGRRFFLLSLLLSLVEKKEEANCSVSEENPRL